jgi:hypothetical protein
VKPEVFVFPSPPVFELFEPSPPITFTESVPSEEQASRKDKPNIAKTTVGQAFVKKSLRLLKCFSVFIAFIFV